MEYRGDKLIYVRMKNHRGRVLAEGIRICKHVLRSQRGDLCFAFCAFSGTVTRGKILRGAFRVISVAARGTNEIRKEQTTATAM